VTETYHRNGLRIEKGAITLSTGCLAVGIVAAAFSKAADLGVSPNWLVVASLFLTACCAALGFMREIRKNKHFLSAVLWSFLSLVVVGVAWSLTTWAFRAHVLPDPTFAYFRLWRPYIQGHWRVDLVSGLKYFPLDYTTVNEPDGNNALRKNLVPRNFLVRDDARAFLIEKYGGQLISPSCPHAKYSARRLEEGIYVVRLYVDDPDEISDPCLVTPVPSPSDG
jgi:hypothetical protein